MVYELKKHTKPAKESIIAVDFDGTVVPHDFPNIGDPLDGAIQTLKDLKAAGYTLIMWTCRESHYLVDAIHFCRAQGIEFRSINHNTNEDEWAGSRKIYADVYIDDKSVGGFIGWDKIRKVLLPEIDEVPEAYREKYDIYSANRNQLGSPKKINEYKSKSSKNKEPIEVLSEFLFMSFSDRYHPANQTWMKTEIIFDEQNNMATYSDNVYYIKKHNNLVPINSTIESAQDALKIKTST